jgi:hypothetical protein
MKKDHNSIQSKLNSIWISFNVSEFNWVAFNSSYNMQIHSISNHSSEIDFYKMNSFLHHFIITGSVQQHEAQV